MAVNLSRRQCVNVFMKFTFCKSSNSLPFKPEAIPKLVVMELSGDDAGKQGPGDAGWYWQLQRASDVKVNVFHGAVISEIRPDKIR